MKIETENIKLSKQMLDSIRALINETNLFRDETDFIEQAIIKQMSKMRDK